AEDGIRDFHVTGVQTCALPIFGGFLTVHAMNTIAADKLPIPLPLLPLAGGAMGLLFGVIFGAVSTRRAGTVFAMISLGLGELIEIGRASCRERGQIAHVARDDE